MADSKNGAAEPLTEQIGHKVQEQTQQVKQQAQQAVQQGKQQAQQAVQQGQQIATRAWDSGRSQARTILTGQKENAATRLDDFVQVLRAAGGQLREQGHAGGAQAAEQLAGRVDQVAATIHQKEVEEIIADTEDFARSQPAVFLSLTALLGLLLARFLKSSGRSMATGRA